MDRHYPADFVAEVKAAFPDWERLHGLLDEGDSMVGRYLCDSVMTGLSLQAILNASLLEELQEKALRQQHINVLYERWTAIYLAWLALEIENAE